ncbi:MAG: hypothetical protein RMY64_17765 [Nostoc sp. DedQUE08]|uniref:hypothetical protein n=1 Tax=Nostoc sp. DedQUE08 TaxID=3075393 RepID=UPI002AD38E90|nr:hypothetical protein [Nostoc sp. DedQUE08]MDZ8067446.1 hypothetical protein [Nostoc sp. DedQUE08]
MKEKFPPHLPRRKLKNAQIKDKPNNALTESTNLFPQLNSVVERAIANMQSLSRSHALHRNSLLEAPPPVKTLSQRLNECIPRLRLGTSQASSNQVF